MFNDIQKHIEKKKEEEEKEKREASIKRVKEMSLVVMNLFKEKDLTINEAMICIEACSQSINGSTGMLKIADVVKA